jgi:membrane protein
MWEMIKKRFFPFTMVLGIAFLMLVSLVVSAALSALGTYLTGLAPGISFLMQIVNLVVSFVVITLLFALMFKILPDAEIAWRDVWLGAAITSLLFAIGKYLIGLYLGSSSVGSAYGAAGSLVVILLWVYYSGQILFFGAEFTQVYANRFGSRIVPSENAVPLTEEEREKQGMPRKEEAATSTRQSGSPFVQRDALSPIPETGRNDLKDFSASREPQSLRSDLEPVEKSMIALGLISAGLLTAFGNIVLKKVRR